MLAVMTKFRNVCAHNDRLFDFGTKDALCDMKLHERLSLPRESGRYMYGKNDLFAQLMAKEAVRYGNAKKGKTIPAYMAVLSGICRIRKKPNRIVPEWLFG